MAYALYHGSGRIYIHLTNHNLVCSSRYKTLLVGCTYIALVMGINLLISSAIVVPCLISKCDHTYDTNPILTVSVQAQNVSCSFSVDCVGGGLGVMSARECCVDDPNGLAYNIPGTEICTSCIGEYMK